MTTVTADPSTIAARLTAANAVLDIIAHRTRISRRKGGWYVSWVNHRLNEISRRWRTNSNGSHFPPWSHHWGHGGTATLALSQLIRWLQDRPVLPLSSWHHWCSDRLYLARSRGAEVCSLLSDAGWPRLVACVLCGKEIEHARDWWDLDGVSGPTCSMSCGNR